MVVPDNHGRLGSYLRSSVGGEVHQAFLHRLCRRSRL